MFPLTPPNCADNSPPPRFAFVDFTSIEHATASLINPKNHLLNGRKLVVEYAGADAVRRGAPKVKREEGDAPPPRRREPQNRGPRPERTERRPRQDASWAAEKADASADLAPTTAEGRKQHRPEGGDERMPFGGSARREKGPRMRPKPGAALALAKRESAAIVPSKGQKITF